MRLSFYLVWETLPPIVFGAPPTREPAQNKFVARSRRKTDSALSPTFTARHLALNKATAPNKRSGIVTLFFREDAPTQLG